MASGSPMISLTVRRGLSELNGSWKIIRISRRRGFMALRERRDSSMRRPSAARNRICPPVGW
jgi:hypothetical protein